MISVQVIEATFNEAVKDENKRMQVWLRLRPEGAKGWDKGAPVKMELRPDLLCLAVTFPAGMVVLVPMTNVKSMTAGNKLPSLQVVHEIQGRAAAVLPEDDEEEFISDETVVMAERPEVNTPGREPDEFADMHWHDLRALAVEHGINAQQSRDEITVQLKEKLG